MRRAASPNPGTGWPRMSPGKAEELLAHARDVAADVRTEPDNVLTLPMRDPDQKNDVFMLELFQDQAAIEAHREARHTIEKGPVVRALLSNPMEVQWHETIDE